MKFVCSQGALSRALNTVSKAVSLKTTIPILKGIKLSVKDNILTLTASNLDMSIETTLDVSSGEEGSAVVSARFFSDIVRKLPNAIVSVSLDEGKLNVKCLGSDFSVVALSADEFPDMGRFNKENKIEIDKEILKDIIKKTTFAASIDEKKGVLVGCLFSFINNTLEAASLDGFRMAVVKKDIEYSEEKKVIIHYAILNEIQKILMESPEEGNVEIIPGEKKIEIIIGETRVIARILEGEFINYKEILPKDYKTRCVVEREDLFYAIERASLFAREGKNRLIKMYFENSEIEINSRNEQGKVKEIVKADIEGESLAIGFNAGYLLDVLKVVGDSEIVMQMSSPTGPCIIKPLEGDAYTYLVLPVRISVN